MQGVKVAVPVTVPEGWVGRRDVSVRVKVQGALLFCRDWKIVEGEGGASCGMPVVEDVGVGAGCCAVACALGFVLGNTGGAVGGGFDGSGIRYAFTDCSVPRGGFSVGCVVVSQVSRCLMKLLLILAPVGSRAMTPSAFAYRQSMASATPTARSLPVGSHIKILSGSDGRVAKKGARRGR